jgi:ribosomal protein S18 acetylase RimI-like enzyme
MNSANDSPPPVDVIERGEVAAFGWPRAAEAGLTFRRVTPADEPFLFRLYASTRIEELAPLPWPEEQKAAFLDSQARAQHADYQRNYAHADWLVIARGGADIGRLYLERGDSSSHTHNIIDIAFLPDWRGHGLGGALLRDLLDEAGRAGKAMSIYVEKTNPAMRLYERLGFTRIEEQGVYDLMRWAPGKT